MSNPAPERRKKRSARFKTHAAPQERTTTPRACLDDLYELKREVGRGASSIVYEAVSRLSGEPVAVKTIPKVALDMKFFASEVRIMRCLRHPNIVSLLDVVESQDCIHLIMEFVNGGELYEYIRRRTTYTERDVAFVVRQIMSAVQYMHENHVCHRDLKPENLLCVGSAEDDFRIKIADFGISRIYKVGENMSTVCGSPEYVAPEMLQPKPYTQAVDQWNVGVIAYTLLCGYTPFFGETWDELFSKIANLQYRFGENWEVVSPAAKDFVCGLLQFDTVRLTSQKALEHPWLCGDVPATPLPAAQARLRLKEDPRTASFKSAQELPVINAPVPATTTDEYDNTILATSTDAFLMDQSDVVPQQDTTLKDIGAEKEAEAEAEAQRQLSSRGHMHVHRLSDSFM